MILSIVLAMLGTLLVAAVIIDFIWTTLTVKGAGYLTVGVSRPIWQVFLYLKNKWGWQRPLTVAGPTVLLAVLSVWIAGLWIGWTFIFLANPVAVVDSTTLVPADEWSRFYFAGYTIATLGLGDYKPGAPFWQVLTTAAAMSGLVVITLAVAYVLQVFTAVTQKRSLANYVSSLGMTPESLLIRGWDGSSFSPLVQHLNNLLPEIFTHGQNQAHFPIIAYFHSPDPEAALAPALARLDEAMALLSYAIANDARPSQLVVQPVRDAVGSALAGVIQGRDRRSGFKPPAISWDELRTAQLPVDPNPESQMPPEEAERRSRLLHCVVEEGWDWPLVADLAPALRNNSMPRGL